MWFARRSHGISRVCFASLLGTRMSSQHPSTDDTRNTGKHDMSEKVVLTARLCCLGYLYDFRATEWIPGLTSSGPGTQRSLGTVPLLESVSTILVPRRTEKKGTGGRRFRLSILAGDIAKTCRSEKLWMFGDAMFAGERRWVDAIYGILWSSNLGWLGSRDKQPADHFTSINDVLKSSPVVSLDIIH